MASEERNECKIPTTVVLNRLVAVLKSVQITSFSAAKFKAHGVSKGWFKLAVM